MAKGKGIDGAAGGASEPGEDLARQYLADDEQIIKTGSEPGESAEMIEAPQDWQDQHEDPHAHIDQEADAAAAAGYDPSREFVDFQAPVDLEDDEELEEEELEEQKDLSGGLRWVAESEIALSYVNSWADKDTYEVDERLNKYRAELEQVNEFLSGGDELLQSAAKEDHKHYLTAGDKLAAESPGYEAAQKELRVAILRRWALLLEVRGLEVVSRVRHITELDKELTERAEKLREMRAELQKLQAAVNSEQADFHDCAEEKYSYRTNFKTLIGELTQLAAGPDHSGAVRSMITQPHINPAATPRVSAGGAPVSAGYGYSGRGAILPILPIAIVQATSRMLPRQDVPATVRVLPSSRLPATAVRVAHSKDASHYRMRLLPLE